ncbi:hypothetical protein D0863_08338 [Hortaea werneckii]|uniref:ABC transporter domain-containing protein n=1 Tax=Hortaea werneckii TaxID=91943 RepID=A0A3M7DQE5_HORWE|nr:hypothetical protein D0863_08338 [Hortaea werneckii]
MASHGPGIIRIESGRETYAPDGIRNNGHQSDDAVHHDSTTRTVSTSDTSETHVEHDAANHGFLNEEGKEEVEEIPLDLQRTTSSKRDRKDYEPINPGDRETLSRLASHVSRRKSVSSAGDLERRNTIDEMSFDDPVLDPNSPKFDLNKWIRLTMRLLDQDDIKVKRAGVLFKNLNISGSGSALNLQKNVGSFAMIPFRLNEYINFGHKPKKHILREFNGVVKSGEMLVVLGRPGSGCSTLLKSMTGELYGLDQADDSTIHYNGISQEQMLKEFKGEVVYNQEVDKHFPHLTVGQTLEHACALRTPQHRAMGVSRQEFIKHVTQVVMAVYGLSHTYNTKVGDDFVRGVSGGERKRVSIAEMALSGSPLAAWDNSTRGLDSATALEFTKSLRQSANLTGSAHAVAIYQASQAIYDLFDKAIVLYEGRQIFFGSTLRAKEYFEEMGFSCPQRQTTGDFLTSVTNPAERIPRKGYEDKVPRTPDDFAQYWKNSEDYKYLMKEMDEHEREYPVGDSGQQLESFRLSKRDAQAKHTRPESSYVVSVPMQIKLNTKRAYQRLWNDKPSTITTIFSQIVMSLIVGSVFYGTPNATGGFFSKGATLFFAILFNALIAISEINSLYAQRPIVEKHKSYAFYHPFTEAVAGIVADIPVKFLLAVAFNIILYFLANLRREPSQFFIYFLIVFTSMFVMSAVFRTMAAVTKTVSQAMALSGVLILAIVVYTGFTVPVSYMHPWFGWIRYINPIFYAFEILIANEFHGRRFECSQFVPAYPTLPGDSFVCSITGAVAGQRTVLGDDFIAANYSYYYSHVWRNFGILLGFLFGFMIMYFIAVEINSSTTSSAEVLVFRRGHVPSYLQDLDKKQANDEEVGSGEKGADAESNENDQQDVNIIPEQKDVFTFRDVTYNIPVKDGRRNLLDNVSGWVKPGTLTALMGTSGAGKTTLLDVLAQRVSLGVVTGDMFVNGKPLDSSFQRKTGYVQQQDLHLETATVRESLRFSALLRQPKSVSTKEKYDYVEDVIKMLNMEDFAEAIVGVPGEGLNVEQRKLLTIGVELAAKPKLLLFLDEPTSGLDSQSAWAICAFLRKLAEHGQAVLCTIHQPSAILFQQFDRLLFLRKGGQTVYFGDIGENSRALLDYFESNGARKCDDAENPAEYMLEVAGDKEKDWFDIWQNSKQAEEVQTELDRIHNDMQNVEIHDDDPSAMNEFAMPFGAQLKAVTIRVFQQYWRIPSYILAKFALGIASGLFIGFSFYNADNSQQGMQNVLFSIFMVSTIFTTLIQQIMPLFVTQRSLYEVRERPSKAYSWKAFLIANIVVEIPYQIFTGILVFACFYYPVVGIQGSERQGLVLLFSIEFFIYASTFAHFLIAAMPDAQTAGGIATTLFAMTLIFNGVMQPPDALPGFWIFMYRVSPLTYWVGGIASSMLSGRPIDCSQAEASIFDPPQGQTCGEYLRPYLQQAPGTLSNPDATSNCSYCALSGADQFLTSVGISFSDRWRNFGLLWVYIGFNIMAAVFLYYFFRVRSSKASSGGMKKVGGAVKGLFRRQPPAEKQKAGEQKTADGNPGQQEEKQNPSAM